LNKKEKLIIKKKEKNKTKQEKSDLNIARDATN